jgi:hypothetical protein
MKETSWPWYKMMHSYQMLCNQIMFNLTFRLGHEFPPYMVWRHLFDQMMHTLSSKDVPLSI